MGSPVWLVLMTAKSLPTISDSKIFRSAWAAMPIELSNLTRMGSGWNQLR